MQSVLKASIVRIKVQWIEGEEELIINSIEVMVQRERKKEIGVLNGVVYKTKRREPRTEPMRTTHKMRNYCHI